MQFAGMLGLSTATVGFVGCAPKSDEATAQEEGPSSATYDVVIAGGGLAALCATVTAAESGARVLIVEQQDELGGNARYAVGCFNGAGTKVQADHGISGDTPELGYEDLKGRGTFGHTYRDDAARSYALNAGETVDWLYDLGVGFNEPYEGYEEYPPTDLPRCYDATNGAVDVVNHIKPIIDGHKESGLVEILLNAHVQDMIMENGACVGVRLDDGSEYRAPSVVLAAGGYAGSKEMLSTVFDRVCGGGMAYNVGEGYRLAQQTGALMDGLDFNYSYPGYLDDQEFFGNSSVQIRCPSGCVWVNSQGNRVCDEYAVNSAYRAHAYMDAPNNTIFYLFNQASADQYAPLIVDDEDNSLFETYLNEGKHVFAADTMEELAEKINVNANALSETIARFNGFCETGVDEDFGRTEYLSKLEGPFYALETICNVTISNGGVVVNGEAHVLDESEQPIPGLFAAGESVCCLEFFGENAIGGAYLTNAAVIGRLAGASAAANALS
jgi:succinate dehydrogenase/fumarate reductase flavoprotein subunit